MTDRPDNEVDEPFDIFQGREWFLSDEDLDAGEEGDEEILVSPEFDDAFVGLVDLTVDAVAVQCIDVGTVADSSHAIVEAIDAISRCLRYDDRAEAVDRLVDLSRLCLVLAAEHEPTPHPPETLDRSTGIANLGMLAYYHARSGFEETLPLERSGPLRWTSALCGHGGRIAYAAHLIGALVEGDAWALDELRSGQPGPEYDDSTDPLIHALGAYGFTCFEAAATALYIAAAIDTTFR